MKPLVQDSYIVKLKILGVQFNRNKIPSWMFSCELCCKFLRPQFEELLCGSFEVRIGPRKNVSKNLSRNFVLMVDHSTT